MMKELRREPITNRSERGQSLVELAISLPVLLLILLGVVDFGMAIFSYAILRDAAQEGALYGSFNPGNEAEIENRARNILPENDDVFYSSPVELRDTSKVDVEIDVIGAACQGAANSIRVNVRYQYQIAMPIIGVVIGTDTIPLTGTATNVILQPPCP